MKQLVKLMSLLTAMLAVTFLISCGDDDDDTPAPDPGGSDVPNGVYIVGASTAAEPSAEFRLVAGRIDQFPDAVNRSGLTEGYMYIADGSFNIVKVQDGETTTFGGSVTQQAMPGNGDFNMGVGTLEEDGAAITPFESGLHHISVDEISNTFYIVPVKEWQVIGDATPGGWGTGTPIALKSSAPGEVVFEGTQITMRGGEFKVRYNGSWGMDFSGTVDNLNMFTNFGGTPSSLVAGGPNMPFADADEGNYTITITYTPGAGNSLSLSLTRTGDAEEVTFDPADWPWGIIGAATETGWDADTDVPYFDWSGNWVGGFYLTADEFKFRTDENWTYELNPGNTDLTSAASITEAGGNFANDTPGLYFVMINTSDEGSSWDLIIDNYTPEIIGGATATGWDAGTPLVFDGEDNGTLTWSLADVALTEDNFAFRVNGQWEIKIGFGANTTIAGANASVLTDGGDANFAVGTAGTYQISLSTSDNGQTFTLTID